MNIPLEYVKVYRYIVEIFGLQRFNHAVIFSYLFWVFDYDTYYDEKLSDVYNKRFIKFSIKQINNALQVFERDTILRTIKYAKELGLIDVIEYRTSSFDEEGDLKYAYCLSINKDKIEELKLKVIDDAEKSGNEKLHYALQNNYGILDINTCIALNGHVKDAMMFTSIKSFISKGKDIPGTSRWYTLLGINERTASTILKRLVKHGFLYRTKVKIESKSIYEEKSGSKKNFTKFYYSYYVNQQLESKINSLQPEFTKEIVVIENPGFNYFSRHSIIN